jgi:hypothetical protein
LAREMVWVERERFHGWACSVCAWDFNAPGPPVGKSIEEMKHRYEAEGDKAFKSHVCVAHPRERGALH